MKGLVPFEILIAIFSRLEKFKEPIRSQGCEIIPFHWIRETVQIEVIIVRPHFQVNISEQFTICECMRPSFEGSVNMDLYEDDYLRKEVSCKVCSLLEWCFIISIDTCWDWFQRTYVPITAHKNL